MVPYAEKRMVLPLAQWKEFTKEIRLEMKA
jgi:hypothetical protein